MHTSRIDTKQSEQKKTKEFIADDKSLLIKSGQLPDEMKKHFTPYSGPKPVAITSDTIAFLGAGNMSTLNVFYLKEEKSGGRVVELEHKDVEAIIPIKEGEFISVSKSDYCVWKLNDENVFQKINQKILFKPEDHVLHLSSLKIFDNKEFFYGVVDFNSDYAEKISNFSLYKIFIVNIASGEKNSFAFRDPKLFHVRVAACADKKLFVSYRTKFKEEYSLSQLDIDFKAKEYLSNLKELACYDGTEKLIPGKARPPVKIKSAMERMLNWAGDRQGIVRYIDSCVISPCKTNFILKVDSVKDDGPFYATSVLVWKINSDYSLSDEPIEFACSNMTDRYFFSNGTFFFVKHGGGSAINLSLIKHLSSPNVESFIDEKVNLRDLVLMPDDTFFGVRPEDLSYVHFHSPISFSAQVATALPMLPIVLANIVSGYAYGPRLFSASQCSSPAIPKSEAPVISSINRKFSSS